MRKHCCNFIALILISVSFPTAKSFAQYDTIAVAILDSMSDKIGNLESCSFKFTNEYDISNNEYGLVTHSDYGNVYLKGPDKMFVEKRGDKGHKQFFFNGKSFLLYSFDKNQYASSPATMTLIQLIDSLSGYYGVDFPGADVFYPDFVDNILETSNNLIYLGVSNVANVECFHIAGTTDEMTYQFWISTDGKFLPMKMSLIYTDKPEYPRYSIEFSDWKLDESFDDSMFEFNVPQGAQLIKLF